MLKVLSRSPQQGVRALSTSRARLPFWHSRPGPARYLSSTRSCPTDVQTPAATISDATAPAPVPMRQSSKLKIPLTCPGCGAPSQTIDPSPGFYSEKQQRPRDDRRKREDEIYATAIAGGSLGKITTEERPKEEKKTPICDRCHELLYQSRGQSIVHPTTDSIQAIIEESPHRSNHIYHVIDAADFPMSLIPNLVNALHLPRLRTQNRRSKSIRYLRGRVADVSFIITRSDLLAPKKEQVDRLMPYIKEVLRESLGKSGKNLRLGNVRLVSSKRGWWTRTVKEDIFKRGGGGWMVGKVNVGKSALVEAVYPKGRTQEINIDKLRAAADKTAQQASSDAFTHLAQDKAQVLTSSSPEAPPDEITKPLDSWQESEMAFDKELDDTLDKEDGDFKFDESELSLLPPAQPEVAYPIMPIVSALPGTTASPIRLPFGNGSGELIDLPGIERNTLDTYVQEDKRKDLVMKYRIVPEQQNVKPGQSLLLGGLVRITPKTDDLVFLMYAFLPSTLKPHVTSTEKAIAIQTGHYSETGEEYTGQVPSNATDAARLACASAGTFKLSWDVTKQRAGSLTDKAAGKRRAEDLPFVVYALDLLIEGVGWVEIVAQVRRKKVAEASHAQSFTNPFLDDEIARHESHLPEIEVFSPEGKFVAVRRPMNGWLLGGPKKIAAHARRGRPRQTISYQKRKEGGKLGGARQVAASF